MTTQSTAFETPDRSASILWVATILSCAFAGVVFIAMPSDLGAKISAFVALWLAVAAIVRLEISHPYIWFGFFFMLYSISGPLLFLYDIHPYGFWGGRDIGSLDFSTTLDLEMACFVVFLIIIGPGTRNLHRIARAGLHAFAEGAPLVAGIAALLVVVVLAEISVGGFSTKGEVTTHGSWLTRLSFAYSILALATCVMMFIRFIENRPKDAYLFLTVMLVCGVMVVLISGQRNFLFRFALLAVFVIHFGHRRITWPTALTLTVCGLAMISLLAAQKMAFSSDVVESALSGGGVTSAIAGYLTKNPAAIYNPTLSDYWHFFLLLSLGDELMTASNNLALIMDRVPADIPYLNGTPLFTTDIGRILLPGFLLSNEPETTVRIYHSAFFHELVEQGAGPGFTLLGHGYMHFGSTGAVMVMAFFACCVRLLYRAAERNTLGFLCFIAVIPIAVYSTRMDLTAAFSQGIKHVFIPIVVMAFISFLRRGAAAGGTLAGGSAPRP